MIQVLFIANSLYHLYRIYIIFIGSFCLLRLLFTYRIQFIKLNISLTSQLCLIKDRIVYNHWNSEHNLIGQYAHFWLMSSVLLSSGILANGTHRKWSNEKLGVSAPYWFWCNIANSRKPVKQIDCTSDPYYSWGRILSKLIDTSNNVKESQSVRPAYVILSDTPFGLGVFVMVNFHMILYSLSKELSHFIDVYSRPLSVLKHFFLPLYFNQVHSFLTLTLLRTYLLAFP